MAFVYVRVEVDAAEVVNQLDDEDLAELGLTETASLDDVPDPLDWQTLADSIRRADFNKACELITDFARDSGGVDLPPFSMARVA